MKASLSMLVSDHTPIGHSAISSCRFSQRKGCWHVYQHGRGWVGQSYHEKSSREVQTAYIVPGSRIGFAAGSKQQTCDSGQPLSQHGKTSGLVVVECNSFWRVHCETVFHWNECTRSHTEVPASYEPNSGHSCSWVCVHMPSAPCDSSITHAGFKLSDC